jgi:hypothetical protein
MGKQAMRAGNANEKEDFVQQKSLHATGSSLE